MEKRLILALLFCWTLGAQTARYPTNVVTDQYLKVAKDRAQTTLNASLNASATSFTVVSGSRFAANVIVTIDNEQISVCGVSGGTFTVGHSSCPNVDGRGFGGTVAASHSNAALVSAYMTAYNYQAQNEELKAIETALGASLGNIPAVVNTALDGTPLTVARGGTNATTAAGARSSLSAAKTGVNTDITEIQGLATPLTVAQGGTEATTAAGARTSLSAAKTGANSDITSLSALSTPLSVAQGGTGQATTSAALTALLAARVNGVAANSVQMATGSFTTGNAVKTDASGNLIDAGVTPAAAPTGTGPFQRYVSGLSPYTGEFRASLWAYAPDFNFTAVAPGGSLTGGGGSQTVTLTPCPYGINTSGTFATPLYLSGGTGTAESVRPSGGTCTSGQGSGTVIISPLNNHSGAWTVSSSTAGIQEALWYLSSTGGTVILHPTTAHTLHDYVIFPLTNYTLDGLSASTAAITRASDYPNGDLLRMDNNACLSCYYYNVQNVTLNNNTVAAQSSGSAVKIISARAIMDSINCFGGVTCWTFDAAGGSSLTNFRTAGTSHTDSSIKFQSVDTTSGNHSNDVLVAHGQLYASATQIGIKVLAADGISFSDILGSGGVSFVQIAPTGAFPQTVVSVWFNNCLFDGFNVAAGGQTVQIESAGGDIGGIKFTNNQMAAGATQDYVVVIQGDHITGSIVFENNLIVNARSSCIVLNGTKTYQPMFVNNLISDCNVDNNATTPAVLLNASNATFFGNQIFNGTTGAADWAFASEGASTNINFIGNEFGSFATASATLEKGGGVYPSSLYLANNKGVDSAIGTVASGATIALPVNQAFTITGTTGVGAVVAGTCWAGRSGSFRTTSGAVTFTAGATVGNTLTTVQNVPVLFTCDGTKIWLK